MLENVQKGDKIVTSGGIHGVVSSIDEKTMILQVSDNAKIKIEKTAIGSVISKES